MTDDNKKENLKNQESLIYSTSLIYEQNINKLWLFLRDLRNEINIIEYFDNLEYIEGDNSWTKGNICSFNWIGFSSFNYKVIKSKIGRNKKMLKWENKGMSITTYKTLVLYRITNNNKTLVKSIITHSKSDNEIVDLMPTKQYYLNLEYQRLVKKSEYLNKINEDFISFKSCIINKNYLEVWKYIFDFKKLNSIVPIFGENIEYNESELGKGSFLKFYSYTSKKMIYMQISEINTPKKRNFFGVKLKTIGIQINKIAKIIEFKIVKIDNKTQFSILHIFQNDVEKEFLKNFQINKEEIIKKLKKYIEEQIMYKSDNNKI